MPMTEALMANMTMEELGHYARIEPDLVKQMDGSRYLEVVAGEASDLRDEISDLENQLEELEDQKTITYFDFHEAHVPVEQALKDLKNWCEQNQMADSHPLSEVLKILTKAEKKVHGLYY